VQPHHVLPTLREHLLVDGFDLVLDLDRSQGAELVDARDGTTYLDLFTFFASNALGMGHHAFDDPDVEERLLQAARHKPSNSDVYSEPQATYLQTFARVLGIRDLPRHFMIEGGALAVENCLKAAFDWKSRRNEAAGHDPSLGTKVMHLRHAFHGRTGYTMSLTNTDPNKTARFPQFNWPRIPSPALRFPLDQHADANAADEQAALQAAADAFEAHPHDIACFIAEPIQAEGGDRHLSASFLQAIQALCREHDALFVVDEVQTGVGLTGTPWAHQQLGIEPDLVAYGKKTHVCGLMGGRRIEEEPNNVFEVAGRLNSTFGGSLVDMVRASVMMEVIERDGLIDRAASLGEGLLARLQDLASRQPAITNARGRGLMCAIDLPDTALRNDVAHRLFQDEKVILLGCGERTLRFRPALTITDEELTRGVDALERAVKAATS
jgi:L-lysine 6-transaminase